MKVLLIDDEPNESLITAHAIEGVFPNVELEQVHSCDEALVNISAAAYDLIITDLNLPKHNGYRTIELIREICPDAHIIILTGSASYFNSKRADDLNVPIFKKSFDSKELLSYLQKMKEDYGSVI
jgi:CheY-like chemotaxis protein